jgi:hypothetical protein
MCGRCYAYADRTIWKSNGTVNSDKPIRLRTWFFILYLTPFAGPCGDDSIREKIGKEAVALVTGAPLSTFPLLLAATYLPGHIESRKARSDCWRHFNDLLLLSRKKNKGLLEAGRPVIIYRQGQ